MTVINSPHHPWAKKLESIGRPCVIDDTFYCPCGASNQREPIVHENDRRRFHACDACGRVLPIYPESIFPAAPPDDSTSSGASPSPSTGEGRGEGDPSAAPLATDGGEAGEGSPTIAARQDAAAAVREFSGVTRTAKGDSFGCCRCAAIDLKDGMPLASTRRFECGCGKLWLEAGHDNWSVNQAIERIRAKLGVCPDCGMRAHEIKPGELVADIHEPGLMPPDPDVRAMARIKRALSDAANARFIIASFESRRPIADLWNLADELTRVAAALKAAVEAASKAMATKPEPAGD